MATRLDRQIEQLEKIVEQHLGLCQARWNGVRCTLPANHEPAELHKFPIEYSADAKAARAQRSFCVAEALRFL